MRSVFCSSSCALTETVAGLALAGRFTEHRALPRNALEARHDVEQRAHVGLLFLHPDDLAQVLRGCDLVSLSSR